MAFTWNDGAVFGELQPGLFAVLTNDVSPMTRGAAAGRLLADLMEGHDSELLETQLSIPGASRLPAAPVSRHRHRPSTRPAAYGRPRRVLTPICRPPSFDAAKSWGRIGFHRRLIDIVHGAVGPEPGHSDGGEIGHVRRRALAAHQIDEVFAALVDDMVHGTVYRKADKVAGSDRGGFAID